MLLNFTIFRCLDPMRKPLSIFLILIVIATVFLSCEKSKEANPTSGSNSLTTNLSDIVGQKWLLYQYRVGQVAINYSDSDTLVFLTPVSYIFNVDTNSYSLYSVPGSYKLNLNGTRWGNLSGTIFDYNLNNGDIQGLRFTETFTGTQSEYYLWMRRF